MKNITFTNTEKELIRSLILLGDSEKLAKETVVVNRKTEAKKEASRSFYRLAYEG